MEWDTPRRHRQVQLTEEQMASADWRQIVMDRLGLAVDAFGHGVDARRGR